MTGKLLLLLLCAGAALALAPLPAEAGRCTKRGCTVVSRAFNTPRCYVRRPGDCPCQPIVRQFRSRRTFECPCR